MPLVLDPRIPVVWRDPSTLQVGVDRPTLVLSPVSRLDERVVAALASGHGAGACPPSSPTSAWIAPRSKPPSSACDPRWAATPGRSSRRPSSSAGRAPSPMPSRASSAPAVPTSDGPTPTWLRRGTPRASWSAGTCSTPGSSESG
ncbi:hypothetical protein [Frigoribacterium sp. SL97]|uniref:hypothetical protein n=1 Tax=Frigoribacterium sp. SL97 TaxID=2994664 RepID=UPI00227137D7|nr:hypothetical protein [Frigoribacterium sp. SL97]WAC52840.1 hypothetical protein OVA02_06220 [Frigoribacterium sp. SL97]